MTVRGMCLPSDSFDKILIIVGIDDCKGVVGIVLGKGVGQAGLLGATPFPMQMYKLF